ncbi:MAG: choice-of-anchor J domain-containing protein [Muribaculaceae bacterium]|nr:choice-of-anchor J domain-containing protein [Muribaculaceae bacterium]
MKRFNYYLSLMLLLVFTAACSDEFDQPPMVIPTAEHHANMTIAEFKAKHWQDDRNYIDTVKEDEIIHGWVTSSDESGNIYKCLYIMDESGVGLPISINQNSLFNNYRIGQEIVLPMKGYFVGKYNGQQQLGYPQWYASGNAWEATFLPQAMWESLVEINGLPDLSKIDTLDVSLGDFVNKTDAETLMKYQGRLVRLNGVTFTEANGETTYSEASSSTNRTLEDANHNTITVRNSNYADFRAEILPEGEVDVIGLLGSYGTTWQLVLRSSADVIGGGQPGTASNPYTVAMAIEAQNAGKGWVTGYAVGAIAPEVTTVTSNNDIEWKAPTTMDNTLVLADDPECKDYTKCIIVPLPQNTLFREQANLKDNAFYYKGKFMVKGTLANHAGVPGVTGNKGSTDEYKLPYPYPEKGVTELQEGFDTGLPSTWENVKVSGDKAWYQTTFNDNGYAAMTGYKGTQPPFDAWLISPALDIANATSKVLTFRTQVNGYGSTTTKFEVYILNAKDPTAATVKVQLNPKLATAPASGYSSWVESGDLDLSQWADGVYYIGFRFYATQDANYATWCVDDVAFGKGGSAPAANRADFETMPKATTTVGTYTSTKGWVATNCTLLEGGTGSNPVFEFIGFMPGSSTDPAKAPTINGGTDKVGTIVSPTLSGGLSKLTFNYGCAYSGKDLSFRVDVKKDGNVVKSWTITNNNVTQKNAYTFEEACSVQGDFTIEFTNLCPTSSTGNKDRVSIWNVTWEGAN